MATDQETGQVNPRQAAFLEVRKTLGRNLKTIESVLASYMPTEKFLGSIMTLCRHNPDLLSVNRDSLVLAVLRVAQLQLSPDPALGQAWIVPRKGKAEFQLGWKGCLALAYRSPLVGAIRYNVVGPRDHFVWRDGRTWVLEHEPAEEGWPDAMDEIRAAWCCIDLKSGFTIPRVMFRPEILRHKERGSASGRNPQPAWATDPSPMALKTVIGDACRRGPFEGEVGRAFALDLQGEVGLGQPEDAPTIDVQPTPQNGAGASTSFAEKFKAAHGAAPIEPPIEADPAPIAEPEYDGGPVGEAPPWEIDGEGEDIRLQFMAPVQVARVRAYAAQLGMSDLLLETVLGGRPEDLPAADEARFLALLRDYRPNGNGKAKR